jgi:DNA modification methylase
MAICGDAVLTMKVIPDNSVDAVVCDAPYGLEFMGNEWDTFAGSGIEKDAKSAGGYGADSPTNENAYAAARVRYGKLFTSRPKKDERRAEGENRPFDKALPVYESGGFALLEFHLSWLAECFRVLKPGGFILVFGGTRTYHWLGVAVELTGFEVRDMIEWIYAMGFPKSQNAERAIDMHLCRLAGTPGRHYEVNLPKPEKRKPNDHVCASTPEGRQHTGEGTALKPAHEPIVMARKPFKGNLAANVLEWKTGTLQIEACEVVKKEGHSSGWHKSGANGSGGYLGTSTFRTRELTANEIQARRGNRGQYPSNVIVDHAEDCTEVWCSPECAVAELDRQHTGKGASHFFYCAKPTKSEKDGGLNGFDEKKWVAWQTGNGASGKASSISEGRKTTRKNTHPTIKPLRLMRYLVRLVTPPGGVCLDPLSGSMTTGCAALHEGRRTICIERKTDYFDIGVARLTYHEKLTRQEETAAVSRSSGNSTGVPKIRRKKAAAG